MENNLLKESIEDKEKEIIDFKVNVEQFVIEVNVIKEFSVKKDIEIKELNVIICEEKL